MEMANNLDEASLAAQERSTASVAEKTSPVPAAQAKRPLSAAIRQPAKAAAETMLRACALYYALGAFKHKMEE